MSEALAQRQRGQTETDMANKIQGDVDVNLTHAAKFTGTERSAPSSRFNTNEPPLMGKANICTTVASEQWETKLN